MSILQNIPAKTCMGENFSYPTFHKFCVRCFTAFDVFYFILILLRKIRIVLLLHGLSQNLFILFRTLLVALCGLTGLKPTYGRVSRYGMIAFASSLDQGGPLAHNAADAAMLLTAMAGFDPRDSTSAEQAGEDYSAALGV